MATNRNRARIEQTKYSYGRLNGQINTWFNFRKKADKLQQYSTQLNALSQNLQQNLSKLSKQLDGVSPQGTTSQVFQACYAYDQYLLWVQRIWEYYRSRFDQRDDPIFHDVLAAADEIVWSCFHAMFPDPLPGAPPEAPNRPAPLPYIAPDYSPQALDRPAAELQAAAISTQFQQMLEAYLKKLPILTISLPPACAQFPWALVYLGHEVGHHVQREAGAIDPFAALLQSAASRAPGVLPEELDDVSARWSGWGSEIFADVFSVLMLGPAAYWAMSELEIGDDIYMLTPRQGRYPAPLVRLALMRALLQQLGQKPDEYAILGEQDLTRPVDGPAENNFEIPLQNKAKIDRGVLPEAVKAILSEPVGALGLLKQACQWDAAQFLPGGVARNWADVLRTPERPEPDRSLPAARQIISGAVLARMQITQIDGDTARQDAEKVLYENLLVTLKESREPTTRAAAVPAEKTSFAPGEDLADILLATLPVER
jgi:hypothetical protein